MKIAADVLEVLNRSRVAANELYLPPGQLERTLYTNVNKVIEALGGKWNRKFQSHVFDEPAEGVLDDVLLTGEYTRTKQDLGQFFTPPDVAKRLVVMADLRKGAVVLEPNAGGGAIVDEVIMTGLAQEIFMYEIDEGLHRALVEKYSKMRYPPHMLGYRADFLTAMPAVAFDRVVMNPPFARGADVDHVNHAYGFLKPGGILVSIMASSILFRTGKYAELRERIITAGGSIENLAEGTFKVSGTSVNTVIIVYPKA